MSTLGLVTVLVHLPPSGVRIMSLYARFWAGRIRGCTIAEHAVINKLADFHNEKTGACYPRRATICFALECSPIYLSQISRALEGKRYLTRQQKFTSLGVQTTNQYDLVLDRWFPFHSDEVEREEKRLLGYFRRSVNQPDFSQGFHSVWLEKPVFEKTSKNSFRQHGKTTRVATRRPTSPVLWLAVSSPDHQMHVIHKLPTIMEEIRDDTKQPSFTFKLLRAYVDKKD